MFLFFRFNYSDPKCTSSAGRDEKDRLLLTEKKAAVDRRKVQPALFNWSTLPVNGTFHGQNGTYYGDT